MINMEENLETDDDKKKLKRLIWISNLSKELTQFRNQIIPFGVSDINIIVLFLKKYYKMK